MALCAATSHPLPQHQQAIGANLSPERKARNHVDLSELQHPMPGPPSPSGPTITYVPPVVGNNSDPTIDTLDHVGPSLDSISHATTAAKAPMLLNGSYSHDPLAGSIGNYPSGNLHHNVVGPSLDDISHAVTPRKAPMLPKGSYSHDQLAGSIGNSSKGYFAHKPPVAASGHRAGSGARRSAPVAPVRLF
jgi:hypothetical protein